MKMSDPGTILEKIMKSGGDAGKDRIRVSTRNGKIRASTGNGGSRRVPEMWDLGECQKCGIWASAGKVTSG